MNAAQLRARYESGIHTLPPNITAELRSYIEDGAEPSGFLSSCLRNGWDSELTWNCADIANRLAIQENLWADWFANYMPRGSFGSNMKVRAWLQHGGLSGMAE